MCPGQEAVPQAPAQPRSGQASELAVADLQKDAPSTPRGDNSFCQDTELICPCPYPPCCRTEPVFDGSAVYPQSLAGTSNSCRTTRKGCIKALKIFGFR